MRVESQKGVWSKEQAAGRFGIVAACLALWATAPALAQPVPPPTGSVSPDGDYAYSGKFSYDPSTCSRDPQGRVYFAVGRRVLRQPMDNLSYMTGLNAAKRRAMPHVRHPEEPVGCPDHPVQMWSYTLGRVSAMPDDPPSPASADADRISVLVHAGDRPFRRNGAVARVCARDNWPPDTSAPDFIGCRTPRQCDQYAHYEAVEYAELNGTKVALDCGGGSRCTIERGWCEGGYILREHFTVNFKFGVSSLPIAHFIAADQELRRRLEAAEVRDFEWMPTTSDNSPEKMQ